MLGCHFLEHHKRKSSTQGFVTSNLLARASCIVGMLGWAAKELVKLSENVYGARGGCA